MMLFTPELELCDDSNRDARQITLESQDQFFATVLKFLIDGNDTNAAKLLSSSNLNLSIDYRYGWIDELNDIIGWINDGYIIRIECPRNTYDVLCNLVKQNKRGTVSKIDRAFRSILGQGEPVSYKILYLADPVDLGDIRAQLEELMPNTSPLTLRDIQYDSETTKYEETIETPNQIDSSQRKVSTEIRSDVTEEVDIENAGRIFLCHKSDNKEMVERYYHVLNELGFKPWLDKFDMPPGSNKHREIQKAIKASCAIVFFITEEFNDDGTIAKEIDHSMTRKERMRDKFAIVSLRFANGAQVPDLLENEIWHDVEDELDGLHALIRALPIKLGPPHWK